MSLTGERVRHNALAAENIATLGDQALQNISLETKTATETQDLLEAHTG